MPARRVVSDSDGSEAEEVVPSRSSRAPSSRRASSRRQTAPVEEDEKADEPEEEEEASEDGPGRAEDDEEEEGEEEVGETLSPRGAKRARVGEDGSANGTPSRSNRRASSAAETPGSEAASRPKTYLGERDAEGFVPGSILRIACHNFMTYNDLEFRTGPRLNMVVAPNGTGKSSIVCAIALGLGFSPKILGRSDHLAPFVKNGFDNGWVEIELKGRKGQPNPIIRRDMSSVNNRSEWTLNGQKATHTKIAEIVQQLNVQVDNLCSFLPQDKVNQFAHMGPIDLLAETQKTAGHPKLTEWHHRLIEHNGKEGDLKTKIGALEDQKKTLEHQIASMQRDVQRFQERERIQNRIRVLKLALPFAEYSIAKAQFEEARELARIAKATKEQLEAANAPIQIQKNTFSILNNALEQKRKDLAKHLGSAGALITKRQSDVDKTGKDSDRLRSELDTLKADESSRRQKVASLRREIVALEEATAEVVERPDTEGIRAQLAEVNKEIRDRADRSTEIQAQLREVHQNLGDADRQRESLKSRLENLKNVGNARRETVHRYMPHVYDAMNIIQNLRRDNRFHGTVYDPVRLCISAVDQRYAAAIEYALDSNVLHTFLCTDDRDYDLILSECNDKHNKGINAAVLPQGDSLAKYQPPVPLEGIQQMGFETYLINLVRGPEYVLSYLCNRARLHQIPIASDPRARINEQQVHDKSSPIRAYVIGNTRVNVAFSMYGNQEIILKSFQLRAPRILAEAGVDQAAIRAVQTDIASYDAQYAESKAKFDALQADDAGLREEAAPFEEQKAELNRQSNALNKAYQDYTKKVTKLSTKQGELERKLAEPSTQEKTDEIQAKLRTVAINRFKHVVALQDAVAKSHSINEESIGVRLKLLQLQKDQSDFLADLAESETALVEAQEAFALAEEEKNKLKKDALEKIQSARTNFDNASQELRDECEAIKRDGQMPPAHEISQELQNEKARLELTHDVGSGVITRYEDTKAELRTVDGSLDGNRDQLDSLQAEMKLVESKWKPRLQELVDSIDERFDKSLKKLGILGSVKVAEDPDYAKWGIQILVAFREKDPLLPLTGHRQSGGERSLSTITYLMSLTELAKSPFTLVDEINQGMDQKYERHVHNQLVELGCREDAAQSWLVTPKLLANLDYASRMRIHCVFNGDWVPETFDPRGWLKKCRQRKE